MDNKLYRDLWNNVMQNSNSTYTTRIEMDKEISHLRKQTADIQYKLDVMKDCNA